MQTALGGEVYSVRQRVGCYVWGETAGLPRETAQGTSVLSIQDDTAGAAFRDAMSYVASAVCLVTTDGEAGRRGVTVTAVCSVSDDPPTLLVCLNHANAANALFGDNGVFAVNVLAERNEGVARAFAGEGKLDVNERFARGRWRTLRTGAPVLEDALVAFDCRLEDSRVVATHRVLMGRVVAVSEPMAGSSLLYRARRYHFLPTL